MSDTAVSRMGRLWIMALSSARGMARGNVDVTDFGLEEAAAENRSALVAAQLVEMARLADASLRIAAALEKLAGVRDGE